MFSATSALAGLLLLSPVFSINLPRSVNPSCARDNCLRAVIASYKSDGPSQGSADCSAFASQTYVVSTSCTLNAASTTTSTAPAVTITGGTATSTVTVTSTVSPPQYTCTTMTVISNTAAIPTYASACMGADRYASACSCNGVPGSSTSSAPVVATGNVVVVNTVVTPTVYMNAAPGTTVTTTATATVTGDARDFPCSRSARTKVTPSSGDAGSDNLFTCPYYPYVYCGPNPSATNIVETAPSGNSCGLTGSYYCQSTVNSGINGVGLVEYPTTLAAGSGTMNQPGGGSTILTPCGSSATCNYNQFCDYSGTSPVCQFFVPQGCT